MKKAIYERINSKRAVVAVVGLGYVGLPMALSLAQAGFEVQGIDINEKNIRKLQEGVSYVDDVKDEMLRECVGCKLVVGTSFSPIESVDAVIICVPTPLNASKEPDISYVVSAMDGILPYLTKETLIILESTTYPGTTKELISTRIEKEKGWTVGEEFYVSYSPERVDPGNPTYHVENTPKIVGGVTENCTELAYALYSSFIKEVIPVSSTDVAEMSKLIENTFRCVNIALMNEMAILAERMGIDVWEAIRGASTKPFGYMPFYPGPGVGGHCIPLDPMYLSWKAKQFNYFSRFIELATDINNNMPYYVVQQTKDILSLKNKVMRGSKILLLGMAYKPDINDVRESPGLIIYDLLRESHAEVSYYDPYVHEFRYKEEKVRSVELTEEVLAEQDLVIIITNHRDINYGWINQHAELIYDTKNAMKEIKSKKVYKLGQKI